MKKNSIVQKCILTWIVLLFIFSIISPLVIGHDYESKNMITLDDLAFNSLNKYGFSKTNYYSEHFQLQNLEVIESEEIERAFELPSIEQSVGPMDSPWPMKCHDIYHTGRSPYSTEDNTGVEKWKYKTEAWIEGGSVIDTDGTIYFGGGYNHVPWYLIALNPNGTLKWKYKTGGLILSTPAISKDGTIYIGSYDDNIYAINPNGTLKWNFDTDASISSSPAIAEDGTIYFGTMGAPNWGCRIYAMNTNGTEKWYYNTRDIIVSDPSIGDDGTIYIGSCDGYLYAINPDGTLKWQFKTGDEIHSHPSIAEDGTIYFDSNDGYFRALYPNGTLRWKYKAGQGSYASASIAKDGSIYITDGKLYALHPNGTLKWVNNFGGNRDVGHSSPAISSDGTIYIGLRIGNMNGGEIISINPDGTERWKKNIANLWVGSSPCIGDDGTVYIGSSSDDAEGYSYGYFYAFGRNETNQPPNPPEINGPYIGFSNTQQTYHFSTSDPDLDDIELYIEWGDGNYTGWIGPYTSGDEIILNHTWRERGTYIIQAKAKDTYDGSESNWATLKVTMPKTYINSPILELLMKIVKCLPFFEKILNSIK